ncbi:MAG: hypothetical protein QGG64_24375, partial [Candidatus Latescibacteria bacterium]|nr:hypothetical protein [Candidatus Latescibacterota bacterium]
DVDEDLDDLLGDLDVEAADDPLTEETSDDDLGDLLGDMDTDELSVGIEDEVAQILTTPSEEAEANILDDFESVQNSIPTGLDASDGQGGSLMVVDTDPDNRTLFKDALSGGDYVFIDQDTPADVMSALSDQEVDLILINLDDDSGETQGLVEQIVSSLELPSIPVLVNSTDNDRIEAALRAGASDYLTLPLDVMDIEFQLPQKVSNQIKLRRAERLNCKNRFPK